MLPDSTSGNMQMPSVFALSFCLSHSKFQWAFFNATTDGVVDSENKVASHFDSLCKSYLSTRVTNVEKAHLP